MSLAGLKNTLSRELLFISQILCIAFVINAFKRITMDIIIFYHTGVDFLQGGMETVGEIFEIK
jgi:hypothetical protein